MLKPGVADEAVQKLTAAHPGHQFSVINDGYFDKKREQAILERLRTEQPDILLVAFGNPMQERWIAENLSADMAHVAIGVGALFDFVAHRVPRAPGLMRRLRIEWVYRLMLEPGRMWRRYVVGNPLFLKRIMQQKFGLKRRQA